MTPNEIITTLRLRGSPTSTDGRLMLNAADELDRLNRLLRDAAAGLYEQSRHVSADRSAGAPELRILAATTTRAEDEATLLVAAGPDLLPVLLAELRHAQSTLATRERQGRELAELLKAYIPAKLNEPELSAGVRGALARIAELEQTLAEGDATPRARGHATFKVAIDCADAQAAVEQLKAQLEQLRAATAAAVAELDQLAARRAASEPERPAHELINVSIGGLVP